MSARARAWAVIVLASIGGATLTVGGFYVIDTLLAHKRRAAS